MKHFATLAAFAASANALVGRADNCCFQITASGGASGDLGQLDDGQNRIGDNSLSPATYCIDSSGGITDESGRGCILTPPTTQFQCDEGATPTPGFSINSQGQIEYNGSTHFVACETGQNGGLNVYTSPGDADVTGCKDVTLSASSCSNSGSGGAPGGGAGSSSVPGGGAGTSGVPGATPSSSAPGGGAGTPGVPGATPSGSAPGGGAGTPGVPGATPSGSAPGGGAGTPGVPGATPSGSAPGGGAGTPGVPGAGGGSIKTTVRTTQTVAICPTETPGVPGGGAGTPGVPGATPSGSVPGGGSGTGPSGAPSGPGGGAGTGPSGAPSGPGGGAGTGPSGTPSGPGGGAGTGPSGTPSGPGGGAGTGPSGTPSGPGGGAGTGPSGTPSGPGGGAGTGPSGTPSGPGGGAGTGPSGTPSGPGGGAGTGPSGTPSQPGSGASCPTDLSGDYEYPHLIIPVDSSSPDNAAGSSFNGTITDTVSTIFNFDIPSSDADKTCSLVFLFPHLQDLETSSYSFSGDGKIDFALLDGVADGKTSFNNAPGVKKDLGEFTVSPGNSYLISTFKCPAGEAVSYEMKNAGSTDLDFFEDYNPSPLGLYITVC